MTDAEKLAAIHSLTLERTPHRGCACLICRIRHVCEGNIITPDPGLLLDERLCDWRKGMEVAGHDKPCHHCGVTCNGFAGNPGLWPICLPVEGMPTWFCTGCIASLRDENERLNRELEEQQENGAAWFNGFQKVDDWLSHRNWYTEADIHPTDPSETLITALKRKDNEDVLRWAENYVLRETLEDAGDYIDSIPRPSHKAWKRIKAAITSALAMNQGEKNNETVQP